MQLRSKWLLALLLAAGTFSVAVLALVFDILISIPDFNGLKTSVDVPIHLANGEKAKKRIGPNAPGWVRLSDISPHLPKAVIASEDTAFYSHDGIDMHEIKAALRKDIERKSFSHGASTLTQQVLKNVYLGNQKTILRKIKEIYWAGHLEKALKKSEILNFYVNMAEWGPGIYGIREASRHYFDVSPSELTPRQSAFLAMLLPSPRRYHSYFYKKPLTAWASKRIVRILNVMRSMEFIDEEVFQVALNEPLWGQPALPDGAPDAPSDPGNITESPDDIFEHVSNEPTEGGMKTRDSESEPSELGVAQ